jgi:L-ascorbate metabolism protein UlaG (beta-lactamase superfamily)
LVEKFGVKIEAVPMYNLTAARLRFHNKGRGNGYVMTFGGKRVYVSGDTEDIPEMRALKNIDAAFVCMNLPYTMTPEQAADAVREFKPKVVYPYHYRGSDTAQFKKLVGDASEVRLRDWYKN